MDRLDDLLFLGVRGLPLRGYSIPERNGTWTWTPSMRSLCSSCFLQIAIGILTSQVTAFDWWEDHAHVDSSIPEVWLNESDARLLWDEYIANGIPVVLKGFFMNEAAQRFHTAAINFLEAKQLVLQGHKTLFLDRATKDTYEESVMPFHENLLWEVPSSIWGGAPGSGASWHTDTLCGPTFSLTLSGVKEWRIRSRDPESKVWGTTTRAGDILIFHNSRADHATRVLEAGTWSAHGNVMPREEQVAAWNEAWSSFSYLTCKWAKDVEAPAGFGVMDGRLPQELELVLVRPCLSAWEPLCAALHFTKTSLCS